MKRQSLSMEQVMASLKSLKGTYLKLSVNKGRKRIVKYNGEILDTFPCVFTFKDAANGETMSFAYSDIICGDIKLLRSK